MLLNFKNLLRFAHNVDRIFYNYRNRIILVEVKILI